MGPVTSHRDYSVASVLLETYPGFFLGGNLYRPVGRPGPHPAVVSPHGHWRYGRFENSEINSVPGRAISLARQGYIVFAHDMVGWNDTMQAPHAFAGPREELWLLGTLGLQLWNSIRVVDYLVSLDDVDSSRIGVTGASGGGTQAFLLAAVDDRVGYSAPVNMVSFQMQGGSPCENAPLLRIGTNNVEFAAAFAPKPQLLVSATGDWTVNVPSEEFPAVQRIYRLLDAESYVESRAVRFAPQLPQGQQGGRVRLFRQAHSGRRRPVPVQGGLLAPGAVELAALPVGAFPARGGRRVRRVPAPEDRRCRGRHARTGGARQPVSGASQGRLRRAPATGPSRQASPVRRNHGAAA